MMELCELSTYNACAEGQMSLWGWKSQVVRPGGKPDLAYVFSQICGRWQGGRKSHLLTWDSSGEAGCCHTGEVQTLVGRGPGTAPGRMKKSAVLGICDRAWRWLPALCSCITVKLQEGGRRY